jgi:NAD(P)-dependent dehydrogenase (short-subunit alcohol dehydrogenase family)
MTLNLAGKSALVTGGTRGIGRAIAERLLAAGASVAVCGRSEESAARASAALSPRAHPGAQVWACAADVSSHPAVQRMFQALDAEFGGLDILVNNAGIGLFSDLAALSPEQWNAVIGVNLTGAYHCIHEALPRFRARGGGWIVNISSLAGKNPFAGGAAYNASKFGLNGMSEAVMLDHRYEGVKVSTVLPGSVSTDFGRAGPADWKIAPADIAEAVAMIRAMPDRTLISHVEIRPSKPPRK